MRESHAMSSLRVARRLLGFAFVLLVATGCDEYIEQATVDADGVVEFAARAVVVCTDETQQEIFGGDPCPIVDEVVRGGDPGDLPFGFPFDTDRIAVVADGEQDRRRLDISWEGPLGEFSTLLVSSATLTTVDDTTSRLVLETTGAPADQVDEDAARWPAGEFRFVAPALVTEHNGDRVQGRIVIWEIDEDRPDQLTVTWTDDGPTRRVWFYVLALVILVGLIAMMLLLERPGRRR